MEINITGKNIKITKSIRDYINNKITRVISDFEHPVNCRIVLEVEKKRHISEIILSGDAGRFYFKKEADDLYKSIDSTMQAAHISIRKFKEKQQSHKIGNRKMDWGTGRKYRGGIRVKNIEVKDIKPMTIAEAVLQLKFIRQNILVFQNAKNFRTYVLFKNAEGCNLIQPKTSFFDFLFRFSKKNEYHVFLISIIKEKVKKIRKKSAVFDSISYAEAYDTMAGKKNLDYLIINNIDSGKINILFRINRNLLGYYEY